MRADKLSISLGADDLQWVTRRAKHMGLSVSAVVAAVLADQRRAEARDQLLASLGTDDISDAEVIRRAERHSTSDREPGRPARLWQHFKSVRRVLPAT